MTYEYNRALKIFSQLYVGIRDLRKEETVPLAFATPYEDNAAGRKRQSSVDDWVASGSRTYDWITKVETKGKCEKRIIDNKPRKGFRITDSVKRVYWGGGNVLFRVEDPDGWEVEIQSANLMALIDQVGLQEGGIVPGECVWARDGAHNILLPITSKEYRDSIQAAETHVSAKIPMKDRVIGHHYILQDGAPCQYLGKIWVHTEQNDDSSFGAAKFFSGQDAMLKFPVVPAIQSGTSLSSASTQYEAVLTRTTQGDREILNVRLYKSATLVKFIRDDVLSEASDVIANRIGMSFASSSAVGSPIFASLKKDTAVRYKAVPLSQAEIEKLFARVDEYKLHLRGYDDHITLENVMRFAYPYKDCIVEINGLFYSAPTNCVFAKEGAVKHQHFSTYEQHFTVAAMSPFFIYDDRLIRMYIANAHTHISNQYDLNRHQQSGYSMIDPVQTIISPVFDTIEDLKQYCLNLAADGKMLKMIVQSI